MLPYLLTMVIYIKIGTLPAARLSVVRKRKPPKVGDFFEVREIEGRPPVRVHCDLIKQIGDEALYYVERM